MIRTMSWPVAIAMVMVAGVFALTGNLSQAQVVRSETVDTVTTMRGDVSIETGGCLIHTSSVVNIREEPTNTSVVVGTLNSSTFMVGLGAAPEGWLRGYMENGEIGYVYSNLVVRVGACHSFRAGQFRVDVELDFESEYPYVGDEVLLAACALDQCITHPYIAELDAFCIEDEMHSQCYSSFGFVVEEPQVPVVTIGELVLFKLGLESYISRGTGGILTNLDYDLFYASIRAYYEEHGVEGTCESDVTDVTCVFVLEDQNDTYVFVENGKPLVDVISAESLLPFDGICYIALMFLEDSFDSEVYEIACYNNYGELTLSEYPESGRITGSEFADSFAGDYEQDFYLVEEPPTVPFYPDSMLAIQIGTPNEGVIGSCLNFSIEGIRDVTIGQFDSGLYYFPDDGQCLDPAISVSNPELFWDWVLLKLN